MKKVLMWSVALLTVGLASCSEDNTINPALDGDGNVVFTVSLDNKVDSRAVLGDGYQATNLVAAVYTKAESQWDEPALVDSKEVTFDANSLTTTVSFDLSTGATYNVVFFAHDAANQAYTFDLNSKTVKADYAKMGTATDYDCFYALEEVTAGKTVVAKAVTLTRPVAQFNIGTNDPAATVAKVFPDGVRTKVTAKAFNTLNVLDGTLSNEVEFTTAVAAAPVAAELGSFPIEGFDYLFTLNLFAPGEDSSLIDLKLSFFNGEAETAVVERNIPSVPYQRNYRTNIYGRLLTMSADYEVSKDPIFGGDQDIDLDPTPWDGSKTEEPVIDTTAKTVTVKSAAQLAGLAAYVMNNDLEGYTVSLAGDIDLGGHEMPTIGTGGRNGGGVAAGSTAFTGVFDGKGYTIKNFTITPSDDTADSAVALFPVVSGADAAVRNLKLENVTVASTKAEQTAAVVGLLANGATVENVNVLSGTVNGGKATAGVVSRIMSNGAVKNCSNAADVTASGANCGGIVGAAYYNNAGGKSMSIENCTNTGNVTSTKGGVAGGIVGLSVSDVKGCTNSGTVTGNAASIGGIVGEQQNIGNVTDCINTGEVINTSNAYGTGGIIGWIRYSGAANIYTDKAPVTVKGCQNTAVVKSLGSVGGIIGVFYNHGTVTECTNTAQRLEAGTFVGGIVGSQQNDGPYIDGAEIMIYVTNNVSTTTLDNMTGTYKNQYVYVNTPSTITVEGNKDTID